VTAILRVLQRDGFDGRAIKGSPLGLAEGEVAHGDGVLRGCCLCLYQRCIRISWRVVR
jgi:hypothetical protein